VGFRTQGEAKDPGFTIIGTYSPCMLYDVGIETARISMPNFLFWQPIWGINTFPEPNGTFISLLKSFPKSPHEWNRRSVRSFLGGPLDEAH
jgi:hypothetical protein